MTKTQATKNLLAAREAIRESSAKLRDAQEVQTVFTLAILMCEAEEQADELLALEALRLELIASLRTYTQAKFVIDGKLHSAQQSRAVSAALVASGPCEVDAALLAAATESWKVECESAVNAEAEGITDGDAHF